MIVNTSSSLEIPAVNFSAIGLGNQEQYAVAIGYMLQLLQLISRIRQVPLRFIYKFSGSRSYVKDEITKMAQEVKE